MSTLPVNDRPTRDGALGGRAATTSAGRYVIAVIGVDRYQAWRPLSNAVRDAMGAAALFERLGFEQITEPLLDDRATGKAIQELVTDDLMALGFEDSLVLFYAGHGGTRSHDLGDQEIKTGYLIPVDASELPNKVATWIELDGWLRAISLLPAKHILVILDACYSGIALGPVIRWRVDCYSIHRCAFEKDCISGARARSADCHSRILRSPHNGVRSGSPSYHCRLLARRRL